MAFTCSSPRISFTISLELVLSRPSPALFQRYDDLEIGVLHQLHLDRVVTHHTIGYVVDYPQSPLFCACGKVGLLHVFALLKKSTNYLPAKTGKKRKNDLVLPLLSFGELVLHNLFGFSGLFIQQSADGQADAFSVKVQLGDLNINFLANRQDIRRFGDSLAGDLADVDQTVHTGNDLGEGAESGPGRRFSL